LHKIGFVEGFSKDMFLDLWLHDAHKPDYLSDFSAFQETTTLATLLQLIDY